MSFHDDESSDVGPSGQSRLESFLFSKGLLNSLSEMLCRRTRGFLLWCSYRNFSLLVLLGFLFWVVLFWGVNKNRSHLIAGLTVIPGCELSSKVPFYTFQGDEEEDLEHFLELRTVCTVLLPSLRFTSSTNTPVSHTLVCPQQWCSVLWLLQVCLGNGAKEESNVVEVTAMNHQGKTISVPIANLHIKCLPMVCKLRLMCHTAEVWSVLTLMLSVVRWVWENLSWKPQSPSDSRPAQGQFLSVGYTLLVILYFLCAL